jgi:hypothetical protein
VLRYAREPKAFPFSDKTIWSAFPFFISSWMNAARENVIVVDSVSVISWLHGAADRVCGEDHAKSREVILTRYNLCQRNWQGSKNMFFYHHDKSVKHLFFSCEFVRDVWSIVQLACNLYLPQSVSNIFGTPSCRNKFGASMVQTSWKIFLDCQPSTTTHMILGSNHAGNQLRVRMAISYTYKWKLIYGGRLITCMHFMGLISANSWSRHE